jgi:hypothetical protein
MCQKQHQSVFKILFIFPFNGTIKQNMKTYHETAVHTAESNLSLWTTVQKSDLLANRKKTVLPLRTKVKNQMACSGQCPDLLFLKQISQKTTTFFRKCLF